MHKISTPFVRPGNGDYPLLLSFLFFLEGEDAARAGRSAGDNAYLDSSSENRAWLAGWKSVANALERK